MTEANNTVAIWMHEAANLHIATDAQVTADNSVAGASWAVGMWSDCDGAVLTVDGILGGEAGFTVNGTIKQENLENGNRVYINDSALINTKYYGLYLAGFADTVIGDATIAGETGIEIRAGNLTIDGAHVRATGNFDAAANPGGTTTTGVALAVSQHTTNQPINVTINDATLTGAKAFYEVDLQDTEGIEDVVLNVAGGHYDGEVASQNHTGFVNAGVFTTKPEADLIAPAKTEAMLTSGGEVTYFIGEPAYVAGEVEAVAKSGDTIEVTQGDLTLEDLPGDITVKNTGDGEVLANHVAATAEGIVTVAPAEITDSEGVSPQTGDLNLVAVLALMAGSLLSFAAAYRSQKARA